MGSPDVGQATPIHSKAGSGKKQREMGGDWPGYLSPLAGMVACPLILYAASRKAGTLIDFTARPTVSKIGKGPPRRSWRMPPKPRSW